MKMIRPFICSYHARVLLLLGICLCLVKQRANAQVDEVKDYNALINYTGTADSVKVAHERYGGLFIKGSCEASDFGTRLKSSNACWLRVFNNYSPRFWPIGGQSVVGNIKTIDDESDAINNAAYWAWLTGGDTVEINGMYEIEKAVWLLENNTYLGMTDSSGFVRVTPPKTALKYAADVGDKKIIVNNNKGFRTRHGINIVKAQNFDSLERFSPHLAGVSEALGGDTTIFLSGSSITRKMHAGDSVSLFFSMMNGVSWAEADNVYLKNLVFDGKRDQYTLNYDWRVNPTILFPTNIGSVIEDCRFYNIPAENTFLCGTRFINNSGSNFNGSVVHFSCAAKGGPTEILYNQFSGTNQVGQEVMQHSEGGMTFSSRVRKFRIAYNRLYGVEEIGIGMISNDDTANVITDNVIETNDDIIAFRPFYRYPETNYIYNNKSPDTEDSYTGSCYLSTPKPARPFMCSGNSSLEKPLRHGELIHITLDSLYLAKSNFNFVKGVFPIYSSDYFDYVGASIVTSGLAPDHQWTNQEYEERMGLIFDNGHEAGTFAQGNWGYELCSVAGRCNGLKLFFRVKKLPPTTSAVPCPLEGIQSIYDGEMNTWDEPILCNNEIKTFDQAFLGNPILKGANDCPIVTGLNSDFSSKTSVTLTWKAVIGSDSYMVFFRVAGQSKWKKKIVWSGTSTELVNLPINTDFEWMVKARCNGQWNSPSDMATFGTIQPDCGTTTFEKLQTGYRSASAARISWDINNDFKYNIRWRKAGASVTQWNSITVSGFRFWLTGLQASTRYLWQIRTVCIKGNELINSPWSELQRFETESEGIQFEMASSAQTDLGTTESEPYENITIVPNPASNQVAIWYPNLALKKVSLHDLQGRQLIEHTPTVNRKIKKVMLPIMEIPEGIHLLLIHTDRGVYYEKLIIER